MSERMRITADTIQFVQPFRNILLCSEPKKSSFTIHFHCCVCSLSHAYTQTDVQSAGMFALRHTQQLSSLAQTHTCVRKISHSLSRVVSHCQTEARYHGGYGDVFVCARYFHIKSYHITSPTFLYTTNWYGKRIPCDRQLSSQKWWWTWTAIVVSVVRAHSVDCADPTEFPLRDGWGLKWHRWHIRTV